MSALHSIKKNLRRISPKERRDLDRRIVAGVYHQSRREIAEARERLTHRDPDL